MKIFNNKIIILLILLFLTIGIVSAVNPDDFKLPNGFELVEFDFNHDHSEGFMNSQGEGIIIYDYTDDDKDILFEESDTYVLDSYENNIYTFADAETELCGYIECIEHNGNKYAIQTTCSIENMEDHGTNIRDNILEFNKINNFKPIPI